jgi:hypothetical protein
MSPFKQSFLGTLLAALVVGAILIAGAVMAQEYYPVRDVNGDGRINTLDIQGVASSWNTSGSPRGTLAVFTTAQATTGAATDARAHGGAVPRHRPRCSFLHGARNRFSVMGRRHHVPNTFPRGLGRQHPAHLGDGLVERNHLPDL